MLLALIGVLGATARGADEGSRGEIDMGIFSATCADLEVRLKPQVDYLNTYVTNIQFTIKWKTGTVDLINESSAFGIEKQGPTIVYNDTNYAVYVTVEGTLISWTAGEEHTVLYLSHNETGTGAESFFIADDEWTAANNGVPFVEIMGFDNTGILYHQALNVYAGSCETRMKAFLQGPYDPATGRMFTHINDEGHLPLAHPYGVAPWNYTGGEYVAAMPDSVVDWVLVELRDGDDETVVIEKKAGLLLDNGHIVDTSFSRGILFDSLFADSMYYVAVWQRNHMPVMTGEAIPLPNVANPHDFTDLSAYQPYGHNNPYPAVIELQPAGSGVYGMVAGDVTANGELKYVGAGNDRDPIAQLIIIQTGEPLLQNITMGYYVEDVNMNDTVKYIGVRNDRDLIIANIITLTGSFLLTTCYYSPVPGAYIPPKILFPGHPGMPNSYKQYFISRKIDLSALLRDETILQAILQRQVGPTRIKKLINH
jgi:hypothetical protein